MALGDLLVIFVFSSISKHFLFRKCIGKPSLVEDKLFQVFGSSQFSYLEIIEVIKYKLIKLYL